VGTSCAPATRSPAILPIVPNGMQAMAWERGELGGDVVCADPPASPVEVARDGGQDLSELRKPALWALYRKSGGGDLTYRRATEDDLRAALAGAE